MRRCCPLCGAKIVGFSTETGNRPRIGRMQITAIELGQSSMSATCANGCKIRVVACPPKPPAAKKKIGTRPIPKEHRAKTYGALVAGWK